MQSAATQIETAAGFAKTGAYGIPLIFNADGSGRFACRCMGCKARFVKALAYEQQINGTSCPKCGAKLAMHRNTLRHRERNTERVEIAQVSYFETAKPHACDSRCTHAKGDECNCSCGGVNHGSMS